MRFGTDECDGWRVGPAPKAPRYGVNNKCFTPNGHNYRKNTDSLSSDLTSPNHNYGKNTESLSSDLTSPSETPTVLASSASETPTEIASSASETPTVRASSASTTSQNDQSEGDVQA